MLLAHLSDENNTPARALETVGRLLEETGEIVQLSAAPRDTMSEALVLEGMRCRG